MNNGDYPGVALRIPRATLQVLEGAALSQQCFRIIDSTRPCPLLFPWSDLTLPLECESDAYMRVGTWLIALTGQRPTDTSGWCLGVRVSGIIFYWQGIQHVFGQPLKRGARSSWRWVIHELGDLFRRILCALRPEAPPLCSFMVSAIRAPYFCPL